MPSNVMPEIPSANLALTGQTRPSALPFFFTTWSIVNSVSRDLPFMMVVVSSFLANFAPMFVPRPASFILFCVCHVGFGVATARLGWLRLATHSTHLRKAYVTMPAWFPTYFWVGHGIMVAFTAIVVAFYPDYLVSWVRGPLNVLVGRPPAWTADTATGIRQAYALDTCLSWFPVSFYGCCVLVVMTGYRILTVEHEVAASGVDSFHDCAVQRRPRLRNWLRNNKVLTSAMIVVAVSHSLMNVFNMATAGDYRTFHSSLDEQAALSITMMYTGAAATAVAVLAIAAQVLELHLLIASFSRKAQELSNEPLTMPLDRASLAAWWVRRSDFAFKQAPTLYYIVAWQVTTIAVGALVLSIVLLYRALIMKQTVMQLVVPFGVFSTEVFVLLFMLLNAEVDIFVNLQGSDASLANLALGLRFSDELHASRIWFAAPLQTVPCEQDQRRLLSSIAALRSSIASDPHATVFGIPVKPQFRNIVAGYVLTSVVGVLLQAI